jgi:hydrogenase expression/formation protein HypC
MCLAVPGQVVTIQDDPLRTATVSFGGIAKDVSLVLVPEATVGDYVVVHVGFAISKLDEEAARRTLELMAQLDGREARGERP